MDAVVRVAMEGLEVLSYLHARGLVHGGLRLDTAGLDHQGRLRLPPPVMDGFAADGGPGRESSVCPPEVLRDPRLWTAAADIFAWGAVIYELVTGVAPLDLARAWDAERWPREIPAHLRDALIAALAPRPQDRPMDAACLRGAFARQAASTGP